MHELAEFLAGRIELPLDEATLDLAKVEFPNLPVEPWLDLLDSHADELAGKLAHVRNGPDIVRSMNEYLFGDLGFRGNTTDYYNPANSCLNQVLSARTGIPISLSVVYLELARRLRQPVFGIGLPGHFVIKYDDGLHATYIDPFHRGRLLDVPDCFELVKQATGAEPARHAALLLPVTARQIVLRMMNNLRGIYFQRRAHRKALWILDLMIAAHPECADEYKHRAVVEVRLGRVREARADFERYLELSPQAGDRADVEQQLRSLRRWIVSFN